MTDTRILILLGLLLASCSSSGGNSDGGAAVSADADRNAPDADRNAPDADRNAPDADPSVADGGATTACAGEVPRCADHETRRYCSGGEWFDETCATGSGCVAGACVPGACSDECNLGESSGAGTCEVYDIRSSTWTATSPVASTHDRAREYNRWLRRDSLAAGGVGSVRYSDPPSYDNPVYMGGLGDSALWTGTYLAAEALRLQATGSADARANVIELVNTLHVWFNVSGDPGLLARFAIPSDTPRPVVLGDMNCADARAFCGVDYEGTNYDYVGNISRDQYQGVMLGYALAYEALSSEDEATRGLIRDDVVEFVEELMKERTLPVEITVNGFSAGVRNINLRFVILDTRELRDGVIELSVDTSNVANSNVTGFREFAPNMAHMIRQLPLLGSTPDIRRSGTAIMLMSFFQVALEVSENVPAYASRRASILEYYDSASGQGGNANDWLDIAEDWVYTGSCGSGYYGNNITMLPMHNLARLETDPTRLSVIRDEILRGKMWSDFENTKNSFFSFIYAADYPGVSASVASDAAAQLAGFSSPPRVRVGVDLRTDARYMPHQSGCSDQTGHDGAVDVADRVVEDFMWQRHPWGLHDTADLAQTFPGVDYLIAYWLGRKENFVSDDKVGTCLAWH